MLEFFSLVLSATAWLPVNYACVPQLFQQLINTTFCPAFLRKYVCQPLCCVYPFKYKLFIEILSSSLNTMLIVDKHCSDVCCDKFSVPQIDGKSKQVQELIRRWDSERELLLRRYLTRTSKYNPLLNIQHDAGRGAVSGCGLVLLVRKALKARRMAITEYSCAPRSRAQHGHGLLPVQQSRGRAAMAD